MAKDERYIVIDTKTGLRLHNVFVLRPDCDAAARAALFTYSQTTINKPVSNYIMTLLDATRRRHHAGL
jgi:hypothetical protein